MTWQKNAMPTSRNNDICTFFRVFITVMNPIKPPLMNKKYELKAYKEFNLVQIISIEIGLLKHLKQLSQSMNTDCATFYMIFSRNSEPK